MKKPKRPKDTTSAAAKWLPIEKLKTFEKNTRTHSPEQLASLRDSLETFGWVKPALIQADGTIIAGHGIIRAAEDAGFTEAKVLVVDGMTQAQIRAYVIADNQLALNAGWDTDLLTLELTALEQEGFRTSQMGFTDADVARLFERGDKPKASRARKGGEGETFSTPLTSLQLGVLRTALRQAQQAEGLATEGEALMAIVNSWMEDQAA